VTEEPQDMHRRDFLRKAAVTGVITAWATPVIQSIAATPAFAGTVGTQTGGGCFHSNPDAAQSCMDACTSNSNTPCEGNQCDGFGGAVHGPCSTNCGISPGNQCCNAGLCNPANFTCEGVGGGIAIYNGPTAGC
jgi:hypothetical protein